MNPFLSYALESGICLAFFYAAYYLFLKKETYFYLNRFYLVSSLLLSFIIPAFKVTSPFVTARPSGGVIPLPQTSPAPVRPIDFGEIIIAVYTVGAALFLARFVFHLVKLYFAKKGREGMIYDGMKVVFVDEEFSSFSFFNVVFLNSRDLSRADVQHILAHEMVHARQFHSLDILLIELVSVLQWFNPFVRPYKKSLQETHEYLADCGVIAQGFSAARYQLLIFEQHVGAKLFGVTNYFKQSQIKRRMTMMSRIKSRKAAKLKLLLVLPLAAFLVLAFADPRPAASGPAFQQKADPGQDEHMKNQQVLENAKKQLQLLKEKEAAIRETLKSTSEPEQQKELENSLKNLLMKQKEIEAFLQNPGGSPVLSPTVTPSVSELKAEYKALNEKELVLRQELEKTGSAEKKTDLKALLEKVGRKKAEIEAQLNGGGPKTYAQAVDEIEGLKNESVKLSQKEADIRAQLEKTQDPQKTAELKNLLEKVRMTQEKVKARVAELSKAKDDTKK